MRRLLLPALLIAALGALTAAPAGAAVPRPFTAGQGEKPTLTVDSSGTAWVAYNKKIDNLSNKVVVCRVPRGATACAAQTEELPGEEAFSPPRIFVTGPNQLALISTRCCYTGPSRTQLYTSSDGGATWSAPVLAGSLEPSGDAILGPGGPRPGTPGGRAGDPSRRASRAGPCTASRPARASPAAPRARPAGRASR